MASRHCVRRAGAALLAVLVFLGAKDILLGQQDDPNEIFLKAYLSAQQAEKLERENRFNTALAKYRFAGSLIETLRRSHPAWQPAIVEYRGDTQPQRDRDLLLDDVLSPQSDYQRQEPLRLRGSG